MVGGDARRAMERLVGWLYGSGGEMLVLRFGEHETYCVDQASAGRVAPEVLGGLERCRDCEGLFPEDQMVDASEDDWCAPPGDLSCRGCLDTSGHSAKLDYCSAGARVEVFALWGDAPARRVHRVRGDVVMAWPRFMSHVPPRQRFPTLKFYPSADGDYCVEQFVKAFNLEIWVDGLDGYIVQDHSSAIVAFKTNKPADVYLGGELVARFDGEKVHNTRRGGGEATRGTADPLDPGSTPGPGSNRSP